MSTTKKNSVLRINGFSRGLNRLQIFSYVLIVFQVFLFSYILIPNFLMAMQVIAAITYYPATIITIICGYFATINDPTDEIVLEERRCRLKGEPFDSSRYEYQCNYCETSVAKESKHCRECDRCVMGFDHHCKWVNNCVAKKNYKNFMVLVISLTISTLAFSVNGVIFLVDFYSKSFNVLKAKEKSQQNSLEHWKGAIIAVCVVVMITFTGLLARLLSFHLFLIRRKITTYEYLMEIKAKNENSSKIKNKSGKEQKCKKKITPIEMPHSPDQDDEDKTAFRLEVEGEIIGLSAGQLVKVAKLKKLNLNFENTGRNQNDSVGIEQVLNQHQSSEDFELTNHLSLKSSTSPSNQIDLNRPGSPHSPGIYKLKLPIAPSVPEKKLKELITGELPPLRHKHRVLRKAVVVDTMNGDQTTLSILQDLSGRKKTEIFRSLTKEGTISTAEKEK